MARHIITVQGMPDAITFTGARLDRAAGRRGDEAWLAAQAADPAARAVLAGDEGVHVTASGEPRLALIELAALEAPEPLLLGLDAAGPVFAVDAERDDGGRPRPAVAGLGEGPPRSDTGTRALGLRPAAAALPAADAGLAAYAASLVNWHRRHQHCAVCGTPTVIAEGGIVRRCPRCGAEHHPRTDPVVIMLVTDSDRVLLGRQGAWPPGRYSALAGFVEPGESLEEAVAREVREEAGVEVGAPRYVGSQPWPFPSSLMIGFIAPWRSGEPRRADAELEDVRWFARADVADAVAGRDSPVGLPPRFAIARRLLEHWLGRETGLAPAARKG
jgi:NAD+ diphosphatase